MLLYPSSCDWPNWHLQWVVDMIMLVVGLIRIKTTYQRTTGFMASSIYFSFVNQYSLGGGFLFPIVLVPRYKLSLCHTLIKPDLLGFLGIGVFTCGLRDHVITRFASCNLNFSSL